MYTPEMESLLAGLHIPQSVFYWIAFAPAQKPYRVGFLFTHTKNGDFGSIYSVKGAKLRRADL